MQNKSAFQRFFTWLFPKRWSESMEADSRRWIYHCKHCGFEESLWDVGGIRWKAYGNPRHYRKCRQCGKRSWQKLSKKAEPPTPTPPGNAATS